MSESLILHQRLSKLICKYYTDYLKCKDVWDEYVEGSLMMRHEDAKKTFLELEKSSEKEVFFWEHCSIKTFIETFDERKKTYFDKYPNAKFEDFIKEEIQTLDAKWVSGELRWLDDEILEEYRIRWYPPDPAPERGANFLFLGYDKIKDLGFMERSKKEFLEDKLISRTEDIPKGSGEVSIFKSNMAKNFFDLALQEFATDQSRLSLIYWFMTEHDRQNPMIVNSPTLFVNYCRSLELPFHFKEVKSKGGIGDTTRQLWRIKSLEILNRVNKQLKS